LRDLKTKVSPDEMHHSERYQLLRREGRCPRGSKSTNKFRRARAERGGFLFLDLTSFLARDAWQMDRTKVNPTVADRAPRPHLWCEDRM